MRHKRIGTVFAAVAVTAWGAFAVPPAAPPKLGLDRQAAVGGFRSASGVWAEPRCEAAVVRIPGGLRFFWTAWYGEDNAVRSAGRKKDDPEILAGESVELLLAPRPGSGEYFHFGINPDGLIYSARGRNAAWNPARIAGEVKGLPHYWQAMLELSFEALGVPEPKPGERWKIDFRRNRSGGERSVSSWSGTRDFHDPRFSGTLEFGAASPVQLAGLRRLPLGVEALFDFAPSDRARRIELIDGGRTAGTVEAPPGPARRIRFRICREPGSVPLRERFRRVLRVVDPASGEVWFERGALVEGSNAALLRPGAGRATAEGETRLPYTSTFPGTFTLRATGADGRVLFQGKRSGPAGKIPLSGAVPGRGLLELEADGFRFVNEFLISKKKTPE